MIFNWKIASLEELESRFGIHGTIMTACPFSNFDKEKERHGEKNPRIIYVSLMHSCNFTVFTVLILRLNNHSNESQLHYRDSVWLLFCTRHYLANHHVTSRRGIS